MGSNPSKVKGRNLPVTNVSWTDCQTFLSRLTALAQAKSGYSGISFACPQRHNGSLPPVVAM